MLIPRESDRAVMAHAVVPGKWKQSDGHCSNSTFQLIWFLSSLFPNNVVAAWPPLYIIASKNHWYPRRSFECHPVASIKYFASNVTGASVQLYTGHTVLITFRNYHGTNIYTNILHHHRKNGLLPISSTLSTGSPRKLSPSPNNIGPCMKLSSAKSH